MYFCCPGGEVPDRSEHVRIVCELDGVKIPCYHRDTSVECTDGEDTRTRILECKSVPTELGSNDDIFIFTFNGKTNINIQNNIHIQTGGSCQPSMPVDGYARFQGTSPNTSHSKVNNIYTVSLLFLAVGIVWYYNPYNVFGSSDRETHVIETDTTELKIQDVFNKIDKLEGAFTKQPKDLWATLRLGMRNLLKQYNAPTTILLLHGENYTVDACILQGVKRIIIADIVLFQQKQIEISNKGAVKPKGENDDMDDYKDMAPFQQNSNEVAVKPTGVELDMDDYKEVFDNPGEFMNKYRTDLERDKILIVKNFHKSPTNVMEAFHYLSDTIDPWVKNLLIIVTLKIRNSTIPNRSSAYLAENELKTLLKDLPDNVSDPLITRLTENVYLIADEGRSFLRISCPL